MSESNKKYYHIYRMECLTSLHVGSGESNYNIIDNEVEKDPVTQLPIIHASGLKGAIRAAFKNIENAEHIFGKATDENNVNAGEYKFFDAKLLSRPMRVADSELPCISVTSLDVLMSHLKMLKDFGINEKPYGVESISLAFNGDVEFVSNVAGIRVEDEKTEILTDSDVCEKISKILQKSEFAVAKKLKSYPLPVVAHNNLISENLWYEEYVPAGSVFTFMIITDTKECEIPLEKEIMQIGANASIGYGYVKITKVDTGVNLGGGTVE